MFEPLSAFELEALWLSLKVATASLAVCLPVGLALALVLARGRFPGRWIIEAAVNIPLVLPPVVTGLILLSLFGVRGPIGRALHDAFGVSLAFHWTGAALAATIMALPLVVRPLRLAIEGVDRGLEDAAAVLGAPPLAVFARVTLPLAAPGLVAAGLLGFARAFGEFGATVTFAGTLPGVTQTMPGAVYRAFESDPPAAVALSLVLLTASVTVLLLLRDRWKPEAAPW